MKIIQKNTKNIYIILIILIVLIVGFSYYVFALNGSLFGWQFRKEQSSSVNMNPATDEEIKAGDQAKANTVENDQGKPGTGDDTSTPQPSADLTVGFSAVNQNDGKLQIRTILDELLSSGTCTLTLTNDNKTVTKTASIYPTASTSTCQGFDVPVSELSATTWSITVKVTSDARSGQAITSFQVN